MKLVSLAVMAALGSMTVVATAATTNGKDDQVDGSNIVVSGAPAAGALDGYDLTVTGSSIHLESDQNGVVAQTPTNLSGEKLSTVIVGADSTSAVFIQGDGTGILAGRASVNDDNTPGEVTVLGRQIEVRSNRSSGVYSALGSVVTIGSATTDSVTVSTTSGMGVSANEGQVEITAKNVEISSQNYFAVHAGNRTLDNDPATSNTASVRINAEHTTIRGLVGIANYTDGRVDINGDVTIDAVYAMNVRGGSLTNINADGNHTVVVNGQIQFASSVDGTPIDAVVNLNLSGAESVWTGNVQYDFDESVDGSQDVSGFNLTIADGATWKVQNYSVSGTEKEGNIDRLTFDNGVIVTESADQEVHVERLGGSGGQVKLAAENTEDAFTTSQLRVDEAVDSITLDVSFVEDGTVIDADAVTEEDLDAAAKSAVIVGESSGDKVTQVQHFAEGDIRGAITQVVDGSGVARSQDKNSKLESFKGVNAVALVQWRNQINHLTKRLGDVRHQKGDIGAWARVYGGEYEWGDANRVDMQTTTVQVGGDARVGDWIVGGAFSYSDSSYDLDNGEGDGDMYSLAVYGTRTFEKGSYVDFVARYGYIKNDITAGNMDVDFDSNAFSLSVEGGHTYRFMERAYVEPQIEVTYGFAQGDDATASNGVKIEQDDYQNLITRIGFRTGFDFPNEAGTIYAHASYSYDFLGEADGTASQNGLRASLDEDLGGGWVTYGIGGQFRLGESTFAYGELERSTGGDVDNPWAFNVGLRHLF